MQAFFRRQGGDGMTRLRRQLKLHRSLQAQTSAKVREATAPAPVFQQHHQRCDSGLQAVLS